MRKRSRAAGRNRGLTPTVAGTARQASRRSPPEPPVPRRPRQRLPPPGRPDRSGGGADRSPWRPPRPRHAKLSDHTDNRAAADGQVRRVCVRGNRTRRASIVALIVVVHHAEQVSGRHWNCSGPARHPAGRSPGHARSSPHAGLRLYPAPRARPHHQTRVRCRSGAHRRVSGPGSPHRSCRAPLRRRAGGSNTGRPHPGFMPRYSRHRFKGVA